MLHVWSSCMPSTNVACFNTLRPRHNGRHFVDNIFKCIFLNENAWIPVKISLKFVPKGPINNIPALVLIMAWRRSGDKPLSEPMIGLPTHICVTRPQWVKDCLADSATQCSVSIWHTQITIHVQRFLDESFLSPSCHSVSLSFTYITYFLSLHAMNVHVIFSTVCLKLAWKFLSSTLEVSVSIL